MRKQRSHRPSLVFLFPVVVLLGVSLFSFGRATVEAGPVTGGSGNWPFVKLGVYQGVAAISVDGTAVIELGANGKDIATNTSKAIAIRPNSVTAANAAVVTTANGSARLKIPGQVCLFPSGVASPAVCNNQWPSGAASLWTTTTDADGYTAVIPLPNGTAAQGAALGTSASPITSGTALTIVQDPIGLEIDALRVTNLTANQLAAQFSGDVQINGVLYIRGQWTINGNEVYHSGSIGSGTVITPHQGTSSGLDADLLDGYNATLQTGSRCNGLACLCFTVDAGTRCAKMLNRF